MGDQACRYCGQWLEVPDDYNGYVFCNKKKCQEKASSRPSEEIL